MLCVTGACTPYRIEHHNRPSYYQQASREDLPDEVKLADGTIVRYSERGASSHHKKANDESQPFEIRSVADDGRVTLRNLIPEHVVSNMMTCIRNEEYDLVYDQLLSERARVIFENEGGSREAFADYCQKNRRDIMTTLNRLSFGFGGQDVYLKPTGNGIMRAGFSPRISQSFRFRYVEFSAELGGIRFFRIY
jgi:hypothetical protein